ncbi:MAG: succinate dehydrogenase/fumarate reductase iron-sulfur subunit [Gammaproteobacteria bacterium]|jgi:fumarate reductase iron-sulfur subunit
MNDRVMQIDVLRYRPEEDTEPVWQSYEVECRSNWVVLDALNHIKDHIDGTLSYRWSCHMAVCGSCGLMVDGEPVLGCKTFLRDLPAHIRVEPLGNFPVERDLVVGIDGFVEKLAEVQPYIVPRGAEPEGTHTQSPRELDRFRQYSMCINCLLCYAACPQVAMNPGYIGPAALALAHRYNLDSRDGGSIERMETTASDQGVWECTFIGECSEACPKHVDPAGAIQQMKLAASIDWFTRPFRKEESS